MSQLKICSKTQKTCDNSCKLDENEICANSMLEIPDVSLTLQLQDTMWFRLKSIQEIYWVFEKVKENTKYMILAGNTGQGIINFCLFSSI